MTNFSSGLLSQAQAQEEYKHTVNTVQTSGKMQVKQQKKLEEVVCTKLSE